MVRTDSHRLRTVAGDSLGVEAIKSLPGRKTPIWERTRHTQRLRHALREYLAAALDAFDDRDAGDTLELALQGPRPGLGVQLTRGQITAALRNVYRISYDSAVNYADQI